MKACTRKYAPTVLFVALVMVGAIRILRTSRQLSQTSDESPNIACGMQWLDTGRYDYGPFHPPLARAAIAASLYMHGYRARGLPDRWTEGNAILHSRHEYWKALKWARLGVLPFFVLACVWVWMWSKRFFADSRALIAVAIFTNTPAVLAHAAVATTDMAVAAGVPGALYAFVVWLERPNLRRSILLGVTFTLAVLSKFSALLFVPAGMLAISLVYGSCVTRGRWPPLRSAMTSAAVALFTIAALVWGAYRFSWGRPTEHFATDAASQAGIWGKVPQNLLNALENTEVPAPEVLDGMWTVHNHNEAGHAAYLLGKNSLHGWWYFFPVAIALKTPLGFLLLAGTSGFALLRRCRQSDWKAWTPVASAIAIVGVTTPAGLNIGVRYVLPVFPMLAMAAALGFFTLWNFDRLRAWTRVAAIACVTWGAVSVAAAHPDYLAYFNEIASSRPEDFLVDSDLDWGQDLRRLSAELKSRHVEKIRMDCLYTGDGSELELPSWDGLVPYQPETGWVAVSFTPLKSYSWVTAQRMRRTDSPYAWLAAHVPVMRVGRSILLYRIPDTCKNCNTH
jgi:hypothetical protein